MVPLHLFASSFVCRTPCRVEFPWMHSLLFGTVEEVGHFVFLLFLLVSIGKGDSGCCCHDPSSHASGAVHSQQGCHSFGPSEPAPGRTHGSTALLVSPRANHQAVFSCVFHVDSIRKSVHQLHVLVFFVALGGGVGSTWKVKEASTKQKDPNHVSHVHPRHHEETKKETTSLTSHPKPNRTACAKNSIASTAIAKVHAFNVETKRKQHCWQKHTRACDDSNGEGTC